MGILFYISLSLTKYNHRLMTTSTDLVSTKNEPKKSNVVTILKNPVLYQNALM